MNLTRVLRALVVSAVLTAAVVAAMVLLTDGPELASAVRRVPVGTFALMLALSAFGFIVRGLRWGRLLRVLGYPVLVRDALYMQFASQTMTVTPGRVGEIVKPWLARHVAGMPMSRGIPLVFAERVADLIAVCILAVGGLSVLGGSVWALVAGSAVILAGTWVAGSAWFHDLALKVVERKQWAQRHREAAGAISETLRTALSWRVLAWSTAASLVAWGAEGVGFTLCLHALGFTEVGTLAEISVYGVATIAGAFSFLPGGIGLTEASMAGILSAAGMAPAAASAATLVTRVATLWWGVGLGWLTLASRPALMREIAAGKVNEE